MPGDPDLSALLPSWELHLRAERKAPSTIKIYGDGVRRFLDWCAGRGRPALLDRSTVREFTESLLVDDGVKPATARSRQLACKRYAGWLVEEGEMDSSSLAGVLSLKPPKLEQEVLQPLTDDELRALLRACAGTGMRERRDEALLRLMLETGMRAGEVVDLRVADVDLVARRATVRHSKSARGRVVPFGPETARAIDRYLRARRAHRLAGLDALWLGDRGKAFTYNALHATLRQRAAAAGVDRFHPHLLRHTAADRWLSAGGSEGGLMAVAGWTRPDMLLRYTRARAGERAAAEAESLNLGHL